jgi:hypothetical protein
MNNNEISGGTARGASVVSVDVSSSSSITTDDDSSNAITTLLRHGRVRAAAIPTTARRWDIVWPVTPTADKMADFKIQSLHASYAFTWFEVVRARLCMTILMTARGRKY